MKHLFIAAALAAAALPAAAHTDLLNQNFDGEWTGTFTSIELDGLSPHSSINALFMDGNGVSQPWWPNKDTSAATDRFLCSHSYYKSPGTSNDWATSGALTVPTEGFTLSFDAQSLPIRSGNDHALSDLWVFITDKPVTKDWQPAAADAKYHLEAVPYGESRNNVEKDFTHYEYSLDEYVGKTIYLSFANLNTDKDILCIDNVLVRRLDMAELDITAPEYVLKGDFDVQTNVKCTDAAGLKNWKLTFRCGDVTETRNGESLANNEEKAFTFTAKVEGDKTADYTVTLAADGMHDIEIPGQVKGLTFQGTKRVLLEESTGTWCGNCPTVINLIESLENDENYEDCFLPVSIHVSANQDPMEIEEYEYMFGVGSVAPFMRPDRDRAPFGISSVDFVYDPTVEGSAAKKLTTYLDVPVLADIDLKATYLRNAGKISGIDVTAEVKPAITLDGSKYSIGFILTENNVMGPVGNQAWMQHNYLSKDPGVGPRNPFYFMPETIYLMRYQDVARQLYGFHGQEGSVPARALPADETYTYNTQLSVVDPLRESDSGTVIVPGYNYENLYLTAFLIDLDTFGIVNANRVALGSNPEPKYTAWNWVDDNVGSVEGIDGGSNAPAEYYNLQGVRVANPGEGIYIVRRGTKVTKEIIP